MSYKFNHDDYAAGRSAGWQWAYYRLCNGAMTVEEVIDASDNLHPLLGFTTGMREAIHDFQEETKENEE